MGQGGTSENRSIESILKQRNLFSSTSAPWQQGIIKIFLNQLDSSDNLICLDAACGIGNNISVLLEYSREVIAFDSSQKAIDFAKERSIKYDWNRASFSNGNLESMPYESGFFDLVVCTEALEHVREYDEVIKELHRVTKPGGYIILSFQNHANLSGVLKFLFEKLYGKNWDVWGTHRHDGGYENYLSVWQIKKSIKKLGLISLAEMGADYINAWLSWIPFLYKNYKILNKYPLFLFGRVPVLRWFGMDYFVLLRKPR